MTMVNESTVELIHAEVDRRLSDAQRAELSRRLLVDEDARALHREMNALRELLEAEPMAEVPEDVAPSILASLPPAAVSSSGLRYSRARTWGYFGAMAAAVALVGIMLRVGSDGGDLEPSAAVGTITAVPATAAIAIDNPAMQGTIMPRGAGTALVLEFDVALREDVAIIALEGGHPLARIEQTPDGMRSQRFSLELPGVTANSGPIVLRVTAGDRLVDELELATPAG
jgi:anti-sigma factor RsiW